MAKGKAPDRVVKLISKAAIPLFLVPIVMSPSKDRAQNTLCYRILVPVFRGETGLVNFLPILVL